VRQNPRARRPDGRLRAALLIPIGISILVHAGIVGVLIRVNLSPGSVPRLVDAPSVLTLAPFRGVEPAPSTPALPEPTPPPPLEPTPTESEPAPVPEPVAALLPPAEPPPGALVEPVPDPEPAPPRVPTQPATPSTATVSGAREASAADVEPGEAPAGVVFAGEEARAAARIVYVIDGSGAMVTTLEFVRREVAASVGRLSPTQRFDVVVFRDTGVERFPDAGRATPERKARLGVWLGAIEPAGRSDPLVGLAAAADLKPELVFFLTRSIQRSQGSRWGAGREATLGAMETLNPRRGDQRRFVVKVVQFLDPDPTGLLPELANTHGDGPGSYRIIRREDLR